ncbi:TSUP family transporter [Sediminicoccus sp. KRV36]|uniref:TSUP family transporter n=1 Tax=Sediminicoccus sp. KRV36 TaxID=3133721 RepID=UPI002010C426|nr:TSUP family transporter [Sediminicoccus rosea]UPY35266.1 TSUP family transporter [Sediminicoccus rosea]
MFDSALIALVFLLAGFSKGLIGLGLPTIAMALLTLLASPAEAAALLLLPSFVTNLVQIAPARAAWRLTLRLWPMLAGVVLGTLLGGLAFGGFGGRFGALLLGVALACYGALGLLAWRPHWPERAGALVGAATGALTAATGVFVIPAVPWLQGIGLTRDELVRALGLAFLVSTLALGGLLGGSGLLDGGRVIGSALALLPALAGQALGARLRGRLSEPMFKRVFFAGLLALGLGIALRG